MSSDVIFEVTKDHLETGMRQIPVGYCASSYIDPLKGIFYSGIPLKEVINWEPVAVIYLLMYGTKPENCELKTFEEELFKRRSISSSVLQAISNLPQNLDLLDVFSISLMLLSADREKSIELDCINIISKLPLLVAYIINHRLGLSSELKTADLSYLQTFSENLNLKNVRKDLFYEVLKIHNILYYDLGGGSVETFAAKVISSSGTDMYSCLAGAALGLKGDLNGKACALAYDFICRLKHFCESNFSEAQVEAFISQCLDNKEKIPGFGHSFFTSEDPRASIMCELAQKWFFENEQITVALHLRKIGKKVLSEKTKIKNPNMNIDGISGAALAATGFNYSEFFPILVAMARSVGVAVQLFHEKKGKSKKMFHPHYIYRAIF